MAVEIRQLRYFVAIAEELHFGRAARRLSIAQPSLSQMLKGLERELGLSLLDRDTRRVSLTEAGRAYLKQAQSILATLDEAPAIAHRAMRGEIGQLTIGFVGLAALDTLPYLLRPFRERFPDVAIGLSEQSNEDQIANVIAGRLDVGIVREPASIDGVEFRTLSSDAHVVALPIEHKLTRLRRVRLTDLRGQPLIMPPRRAGTALYDRIVGACAAAGFSPHIVQETVRMTTMIGLVAAGVGVAILPSIARQIHQVGVEYRPVHPSLVIETGLIWSAVTLAEKRPLAVFLDAARTVSLPRHAGSPRPQRLRPKAQTSPSLSHAAESS